MKISNTCAFCERGSGLQDRVFYERRGWFAFLAAPAYANGHAIVARVKSGSECPTVLNRVNLQGSDLAIADVVEAIRSHYKPADVLIASLRGREPHMHWHLIPRWQEPERAWRLESRYEGGHLFEFLADADRKAQSRAFDERVQMGWTADEQRVRFCEAHRSDIEALSRLLRGSA